MPRETARNWCVTINNPTEADLEAINHLNSSVWMHNVKFAIFGEEIGEEGTPHLQGYLELKDPRRLGWVSARLPRAHLEVRKGKRHEAIAYCLKEIPISAKSIKDCTGLRLYGFEDNFENLLALGQPSRSDGSPVAERLSVIQAMIQDGKTEKEIADDDFEVWCKYFRAFERYRTLITKPRDHVVFVHVVQGPTGTGKSRWAMDNWSNAYWKQRSNWWDGYSGHETVVIDEFYGWLPFDLLLRICDRYPLLVESKDGQIQFVAERVVITTNSLPEEWYKTHIYFKSFVRRVHKWHIMPKLGEHIEFSDYSLAKAHFINN